MRWWVWEKLRTGQFKGLREWDGGGGTDAERNSFSWQEGFTLLAQVCQRESLSKTCESDISVITGSREWNGETVQSALIFQICCM